MTDRSIPAAAIGGAARLAELFERDHELVVALNAAQERLRRAKDRLTSRLFVP